MFTFRSCQRKTGGLQRFAVALLVSTASIFANAGDISVSARDVNEALWRGDHMEVKYSAQAKWAANDPRYKVIPIKYTPKQIVKRALSNAKRNPGAAAVAAAVAGVAASSEWVIDELTGQITSPSTGVGDANYVYIFPYVQGRFSGSSDLTIPAEQALRTWFNQSGYDKDVIHDVTIDIENLTISGEGSLNGDWVSKTLNFHRESCAEFNRPECAVQDQVLSDSQIASALQQAFSGLSGSHLRDFFKDENLSPETTPQLGDALQDWANEIAAQENLDASDAVEEAPGQGAAAEIQDVRVVDPVAIDGSNIPLEIPDSIWKYAGDIFEKRKDEINDITGSSYQVPGIDFAPDLPQSRACQSIPLKFMGASVNFPGPAGCSALEKLKEMFAYLLYVTTAWVCLQVLTKPRSI